MKVFLSLALVLSAFSGCGEEDPCTSAAKADKETVAKGEGKLSLTDDASVAPTCPGEEKANTKAAKAPDGEGGEPSEEELQQMSNDISLNNLSLEDKGILVEWRRLSGDPEEKQKISAYEFKMLLLIRQIAIDNTQHSLEKIVELTYNSEQALKEQQKSNPLQEIERQQKEREQLEEYEQEQQLLYEQQQREYEESIITHQDPILNNGIYTFFSIAQIPLRCDGNGFIGSVNDEYINDGGHEGSGDSLEVYCDNSITRTCLSEESSCPWRYNETTAESVRCGYYPQAELFFVNMIDNSSRMLCQPDGTLILE